jgi:phytoene synthase
MRAIDDLIDNHKAANRIIAQEERVEFIADVNEWLNKLTISDDCIPGNDTLVRTIEKFRIPVWPLEEFAKSMVYDINNDGFPKLASFLEYAQGASVAPASIFVHLTGLTRKNGTYTEPSFNVREAATPCAIFSYLVHIIRDFQKDQFNNLNYFADDIVLKNHLTRRDLRDIAHGRPVSGDFRNMMKEYYDLAEVYRNKTREIIIKIRPLLEPRYQLSLEIIFDLYLMVFERIDIDKGNFTSFELNPTPEETRERVYETIMSYKI